MDDELGVKVTRLRRRLSVEADGAQSPASSAPSTPTKKRGTRLAKPALEQIVENVTEDVPKRTTRKSIARDAVDPVEEKPMTPSRRSTRIRSNTSLVLETPQNVVDSPRARRANRRTSLLGSDTETASTPARTRRTRKDSTSSVDKLAVTNTSETITAQVAESIAEEPEKEVTKDKLDISQNQSPKLRKSPRLNTKNRKSIDEAIIDIIEKKSKKEKTLNKSTKSVDESSPNGTSEVTSSTGNDKTEDKHESKDSKIGNLSLTSANLINEIDTNPKNKSILNTTVSAIEEMTNEKSKRKRTKSWTTITSSMSKEDGNVNITGSGDSFLKANEEIGMKSPNKSINKSSLVYNSSMENKENIQIIKSDVLNTNDTIKLLEQTPSKDMQTVVFMEDSDSNSGKLIIDQENNGEKLNDSGDQCVPVVPASKRSQSESFAVEPMDIDETIPENVTINDFSDKTNSSREEDKVPDSNSISNQSLDINASPNKSKRTSSISLQQNSNNFILKTSIGASEESHDIATVYKSDRLSLSENSQTKSSIINLDKNYEDHDKSKNNSSNSMQDADPNKSKRKSSLSNKSDRFSLSDKYQTKSSPIQDENSENFNNSKIISLNSIKDEKVENCYQNSNKSKRKSSLSKEPDIDKSKSSASPRPRIEDKINESFDKSKRKSDGDPQQLEKTANENKSTLVLSHLKDVSANEVSNVSKSANDTNNELSKSVNVPAHDSDKKILSLTYQTSTPLQQKPFKKMAMQINTSIISPNPGSKNTSKIESTPTTKKNESNVSQNSDSTDESDNESREQSTMIDDEAEEASEDYESGDSRNDEEKQYEKDHEIVDKGETIESEEELSDDSDYEKDSFVVSSNEEDDDLLSGSGDDLSDSDNNLKMTAKSKKKFNERKRKEQQKASREMYEARHSLNNSNESNKLKEKKSKRQRLESSMIESEKEEENEPNKKNRLRIDSSQEENLNETNADESVRVKKKKVKRLSESICEENTVANEKEITIFNQSVTKNNDPLSVVVKNEPKTPMKDFNLSTVQITDDIEEVQVDTNTSVMKPYETSDPLQATLAQDEESESDISENMEIKENYESVLENLNKSNNIKKLKTLDTSLNLNKKSKNKKEPIMEELNLTEVKKTKKNKVKKVAENNKTNEIPVASQNEETSAIHVKNDEGETSDSIDMKLLFPEDSNDSEMNANKFKLVENEAPGEVFIPLKRTEAKTNVRESLESENTSKNDLNVSQKKTKNRKSTQPAPELTITETEDISVNFFIDTKGDIEDVDISTHNSAKKNKKKHKQNNDVSQSALEFNETLERTAIEETPQNNTLQYSDKKKKKKDRSLNASQIETEQTPQSILLHSDKKKKNKSLDASQIETEETPQNVTLSNSDKKKKKNKSLNASQLADEPNESVVNVSVKSDKRNQSDVAVAEETEINVSLKSEKKKKKKNKSFNLSETGEEATLQVLFANNEMNTSNVTGSEEVANISLNSEKKKKKKSFGPSEDIVNMGNETSEAPAEDEQINTDNAGADETAQIEKKKKKKKNKSQNSSQIIEENTACQEVPIDILLSPEKKKKKKNKVIESSPLDKAAFEESSENVPLKSKKIKKGKTREVTENWDTENSVTEDTLVSATQKRKKKIKLIEYSDISNYAVFKYIQENVSSKSPKKKIKNTLEVSESCDADISVSEISILNTTGSKKKYKLIKLSDIHNTAWEETILDASLKSNKKKKKSRSNEVSDNYDTENALAVPEKYLMNVSQISKKQKDKKNKSIELSESCINTASEESPNMNLIHDKKKRKNKSLDVSKTITNDDPENEELPLSLKTDKKKKKNKSHTVLDSIGDTAVEEDGLNTSVKSDKKKKKKKKNSVDVAQEVDQGEESDEAPMEVSYKSEKKSDIPEPEEDETALNPNERKNKKKKKKKQIPPQSGVTMGAQNDTEGSKKRKRDTASTSLSGATDDEMKAATSQNKKRKFSDNIEQGLAPTEDVTKTKSKKRKATDDDTSQKKSKVLKENSFDKVHVPRLPASIVSQLEDNPKESKQQKKLKVLSTLPFEVVEEKKRKNKPSNYLEESIYLNDADSPVRQKPTKQKTAMTKPKVLPFVPTAITSGKGFTSKFEINILPQETQFLAQASNVTKNYKNDFLAKQRIKKFKTFERFKKQRNQKLSKF